MFDWLVNLTSIFVFDILGLVKGTHLGEALHFFIYDTIKIFILLITIIFLVTIVIPSGVLNIYDLFFAILGFFMIRKFKISILLLILFYCGYGFIGSLYV